jgi:hypothetical protein
MQYDVKAKHMSATGVAVNTRTRIKGAVISANSAAATRNILYADNVPQLGTYNIPGTTVCTVTVANTLVAGDRVYLDFTSGNGVDGAYTVVTAGATSFTVTTGILTTSGNVSSYTNILMEADCYNSTAYSILIPGEGILAETGVYVGLPANVTSTVFYG